jgi:hypothetical protein
MRSAWPNIVLPVLLVSAFGALPNPAAKTPGSAKYVEARDAVGLNFQFRRVAQTSGSDVCEAMQARRVISALAFKLH